MLRDAAQASKLERSIVHWIKPLVHPVTDGRATDAGVGIDDIPVFLEVAH